MHVLVKELPGTIQSALRSAGYHGRDIDVEVGDSFRAPSSFGAGHRAQVIVVNLQTGQFQHEVGSWGGGNPFESRPVDQPGGRSPLPPGFVALTSGHTKIWHLHVNPENAVKLLPARESADVSVRELWLLWSFRALTSAGRKDEWQRSRRGNPVGGPPSAAELEELARKGLIKVNRAGAAQITTEGRNVVGNLSDYQIVEKAKGERRISNEELGLK